MEYALAAADHIVSGITGVDIQHGACRRARRLDYLAVDGICPGCPAVAPLAMGREPWDVLIVVFGVWVSFAGVWMPFALPRRGWSGVQCGVMTARMAVSTGLLVGYCGLAVATGLAIAVGGTRRPVVALGVLGLAVLIVAMRMSWPASLGGGALGWLFYDGFFVGRHAHLAWHGVAGLRALGVLRGASAGRSEGSLSPGRGAPGRADPAGTDSGGTDSGQRRLPRRAGWRL